MQITCNGAAVQSWRNCCGVSTGAGGDAGRLAAKPCSAFTCSKAPTLLFILLLPGTFLGPLLLVQASKQTSCSLQGLAHRALDTSECSKHSQHAKVQAGPID